MTLSKSLCFVALILGLTSVVLGQDAGTEAPDASSNAAETALDKVEEIADVAKEKTEELQKQVDSSERAQEVASGILEPIYSLAESFGEYSAFYWVAFALMATGVVSFALQLVLGKLIALAKSGFSLSEILADALGLLISLVGLVLTTQAATENSSFASSAFAVLSATALGVVLGFMFYVWGQRQELQAIEARKALAASKSN